jgi:hypothetical protein
VQSLPDDTTAAGDEASAGTGTSGETAGSGASSKKKGKWFDAERCCSKEERKWETTVAELKDEFKKAVAEARAALEDFTRDPEKMFYVKEMAVVSSRLEALQLVSSEAPEGVKALKDYIYNVAEGISGPAPAAAESSSASQASAARVTKSAPCATYKELETAASLLEIRTQLLACSSQENLNEIIAMAKAKRAAVMELVQSAKSASKDLYGARLWRRRREDMTVLKDKKNQQTAATAVAKASAKAAAAAAKSKAANGQPLVVQKLFAAIFEVDSSTAMQVISMDAAKAKASKDINLARPFVITKATFVDKSSQAPELTKEQTHFRTTFDAAPRKKTTGRAQIKVQSADLAKDLRTGLKKAFHIDIWTKLGCISQASDVWAADLKLDDTVVAALAPAVFGMADCVQMQAGFDLSSLAGIRRVRNESE